MISISIIIVTYNCAQSLIETLQSVCAQVCNDYEVIFVDGGSKDNTLNIIKEYCVKKQNCKYISERDNGIYDAMNKGVKLAKGNIIYFLNAKDRLYDKYVIKDIIKYFETSDEDIIYGHFIKDLGNIKLYKTQNFLINDSWRVIWSICHQSLFAKKGVFNKIGNFNLKYKIAADNEWLTRCLVNGIKFKHVNRCICYYDMNGFSMKNRNVGLIENREYSLKLLKGKLKLIYYLKLTYMKIKNPI